MKTLKIFFLIFTFGMIGSVQAQSEQYFQENIAITNVNAVNKSDGTFFYELTLTDFGKEKQLPEGFGLNGYVFLDNGKFNDKKAGDGVYSAQQTKDSRLLKIHPISKKVAYDSDFKHLKKLGAKAQRGIGCKFRRCGCPCPDGTCLACEWWGFDCWEAYECEFIIGINI